jgi:hypothetical protein
MMTGLPIRTKVDLTVARNVLRRRISGERYTPTFRARAAAVLTAMSELIFATNMQGSLDIRLVSQPDKKGIKFITTFVGNDLQAHCDKCAEEIKGIADEVEWSLATAHKTVVANVWSTE